jgi:hypothetical protein
VEMGAAAGMGPPSLSAVSTALRCSYLASGRPAGVCRQSRSVVQTEQECADRAGVCRQSRSVQTEQECADRAGVCRQSRTTVLSKQEQCCSAAAL